MMKRYLLLFAMACLFVLPALAQDDEGGDDTTLDPGLQWRLACASWDRREYDDAAALMMAYADTSPDDPNALEAWWRSYLVYRDYRPNPDRKKKVYEKAIPACERWEKKYADTDKNRAAAGMWYRALLLDREGGRTLATTLLLDLEKRFPETNLQASVFWTLGEWLREARRFQEAIPQYAGYRKVAGIGEQSAMAAFREGWCYEAVNDPDSAAMAYREVLKGGYHPHWGQVHWGLLDAGRRLRKLGNEEMARQCFLFIVDKCPKEWDVTRQAYSELGETGKNVFKVYVYPYQNYNYNTSNMSINGGTKLDLSKELNLLVRLSYVSKDAPFKGTFTVTPKAKMAKVPTELTADEAKKVFTADIQAPDGNGNIQGDRWFNFLEETQKSGPPDALVVTRSWEKAGNDWGECTIRIQSTARWHIYIYLPNNRTNTNNLNVQPNEVRDNGKTFRWYDWYDLNQGMTIKFPIEVGTSVAEYYPAIRLERWAGGRYPDQSATGADASYEMKEASLKLTSENQFPYTYSFQGSTIVTLESIQK